MTLLPGEKTVGHGVLGTGVVAGEAMGAMALPAGRSRGFVEGDVVERANPGAAPAPRAAHRFGTEVAVGNEQRVEERAQHVALQPGAGTGHDVGLRRTLAGSNPRHDSLELCLRPLRFLGRCLRCVG